jgi:site-specific DNA-methyltransferase (adenine-specific)
LREAEVIDLPTESEPVRIIQGDCLDVLRDLPTECVGAVITDPPYSSGGMFRGDRTASTISKYVQSGVQVARTEFGGDTRDQRSFFAWSTLWLCGARAATVPGGTLCCFIDWRQLPVMTDAVQAGGWTWRNLATWWKPGVRMQRGRFSGSAEYVVYGTNGANDSDGEHSPQNVFSCQPVSGDDKEHIAEKPIEVLKWMLSVTPKDCLILDPFCGTGTTGVAAVAAGRRFLGIEIDPQYCEIARRRINAALGVGGLFSPKPTAAGMFDHLDAPDPAGV